MLRGRAEHLDAETVDNHQHNNLAKVAKYRDSLGALFPSAPNSGERVRTPKLESMCTQACAAACTHWAHANSPTETAPGASAEGFGTAYRKLRADFWRGHKSYQWFGKSTLSLSNICEKFLIHSGSELRAGTRRRSSPPASKNCSFRPI